MNKTQSPIVALVGRPNVGKSALFNRLTKTRKAIVDSTPGVTRDRHYENVVWNERMFVLVDTGGIEAGKAPSDNQRFDQKGMEQSVQEQTWQAINDAHVILFMLDGRQELTAEDYEVVSLLRRTDKPLYYVVNKIDSPELEQKLLPTFYELGADRLWAVSAAHGYGIGALLDDLTGALPVIEEPDRQLPADTLKVGFIGRPNVGKSSLVNRLLGSERMVVSDVPGTTRDSVDSLLQQNGKNYLLVDTAGIRRRGKVSEKLEKFSVMQALSSIERCDLVFVLIDALEGITEQDTKVIGYALERGRACIVLINKWDLISLDKKQQKWIIEGVERATSFIGYAPSMKMSALTGAGLKQLFPTISKVYQQYSKSFSTNRLNKILQRAIEAHTPTLYKNKRIKFYYTTQVSTCPPTFIIFVNYPDGVHFSYYRYLVNSFRTGLGLDESPVRIFLRERERKPRR